MTLEQRRPCSGQCRINGRASSRSRPLPAPATCHSDAVRGAAHRRIHRARTTYAGGSTPHNHQRIRAAREVSARQAVGVRPGVRKRAVPPPSATTCCPSACADARPPSASRYRYRPVGGAHVTQEASAQAPRRASNDSSSRADPEQAAPLTSTEPRPLSDPGTAPPDGVGRGAPDQRLSPSDGRWFTAPGEGRIAVPRGVSTWWRVSDSYRGELQGLMCATLLRAGEWWSGPEQGGSKAVHGPASEEGRQRL